VSVSRAGFLERVDERAAAEFRAAARPRRYPKGSLLFAEGDRAHEVMVITSGAVKIVVTAASGREVVLDVLEAGDLLGEISAIDGGDRSATAMALTPVEVLTVAQTTFQALVAEHAAVARELLTLLAARLRGADRRQLEFGANDAIGRVCQRLVELATRYGTDGPGGRMVLTTPLSQQELASWAGLSREAVVKGLRALRTLGWVESDGGKVVIVDQESVSQRALL
jgi:CRP/FNR family cyclic AMP-dependent transcriptional regulator